MTKFKTRTPESERTLYKTTTARYCRFLTIS